MHYLRFLIFLASLNKTHNMTWIYKHFTVFSTMIGLGMTFDSNLTFNKHTSKIIIKASNYQTH